MTEQTSYHETDSVAAEVVAAWADVLGPPRTPDDSFLDSGGHSLAAASLLSRLRDLVAAPLPDSLLLRDNMSLAKLLRHVDSLSPSVRERAPAGDIDDARTTVALAPGQRGLWVWHQLHVESPAYNVVRVLAIDGRVDLSRLQVAVADVTARHEALRCAVVASGRQMQPELTMRPKVDVTVSELIWDPEADAKPDRLIRQIADEPFRLERPPLWRIGTVVDRAGRSSWLVVVLHHLIADLRSSDVLLSDLATAYGPEAVGGRPDQRPLPPGLLAAVRHEHARTIADADDAADDLKWWAEHLAGLPAGRPPPLSQPVEGRAYAGQVASVTVEQSVVVDAALARLHTTPAVFFLTAAAAVLAAWRGTKNVVVGVPSIRRLPADFRRTMGFFLDTLPLLIRLGAESSFAAACAEARNELLDAMEHARPPYDEILHRLRLPRTDDRTPLIQLWFNDISRAECPAEIGGRPATEYDLAPLWALFDLNIYLTRHDDSYRLHLVWPDGLLAPGDARALVTQVARLAEAAAADPFLALEDLSRPAADPGRRAATVVRAARQQALEPTPDGLHRHAERRPQAAALVDEDGVVDRATLAAGVDTVAARLQQIKPGSAVVLPARRDRDFVVRLVGCWRAGITPVLVDASWPEDRYQRAIDVSGATAVMGSSSDLDLVHRRPDREPVVEGIPPTHVLFTSGTVRHPLPVSVPTALMERAIDELRDQLAITESDRCSFLSGPAHDPGLRDVGLALRSGATLVIPPPAVMADLRSLSGWLRDSRVTVAGATPHLLSLALGFDAVDLPDLRVVICAGAPLTAETVRLLRTHAPGALIVNGYGCTETPQLVTALRIAPTDPVPDPVSVGAPLPGRRLETRNDRGDRVDVGHLGEVWVADPHLAYGYLGPERPRRFVTEDDGVRWFRTGDLGRVDSLGRLHLAGRADNQILVNGDRITPAEIEWSARSIDGVAEAAVEVVRTDGADSIRLWIRPETNRIPTVRQVRDHLRALLPAPAVPAAIMITDRFELTTNLKPAGGSGVRADVQPLPEATALVAAIVASVAGAPIEPDVNFFDAGLTSVDLLHLAAETAESSGRPVSPVDVFTHPSARRLAQFLSSAADSGEAAAAAAAGGVRRTSRLATSRAARRRARRIPDCAGHESPPDPG